MVAFLGETSETVKRHHFLLARRHPPVADTLMLKCCVWCVVSTSGNVHETAPERSGSEKNCRAELGVALSHLRSRDEVCKRQKGGIKGEIEKRYSLCDQAGHLALQYSETAGHSACGREGAVVSVG
jgi:hypothetical protein